jgi:phosphatidylglycerophosphatase A
MKSLVHGSLLLFVPKEFWYIVVTFFVWRMLDIIKPFPARQAERLNGGWGIVLDDVVSGIYTIIFIQILILIIN